MGIFGLRASITISDCWLGSRMENLWEHDTAWDMEHFPMRYLANGWADYDYPCQRLIRIAMVPGNWRHQKFPIPRFEAPRTFT